MTDSLKLAGLGAIDLTPMAIAEFGSTVLNKGESLLAGLGAEQPLTFAFDASTVLKQLAKSSSPRFGGLGEEPSEAPFRFSFDARPFILKAATGENDPAAGMGAMKTEAVVALEFDFEPHIALLKAKPCCTAKRRLKVGDVVMDGKLRHGTVKSIDCNGSGVCAVHFVRPNGSSRELIREDELEVVEVEDAA